jgi:hypothetical protein
MKHMNSYLFSRRFAPILGRDAAARKWAAVALGLALLCGLPVIASALPVSVPALTASQLRGRILASAGESYAGYAESNATFGLPSLAGLADLTSLLDGVTKMRVWQAAPDRWRRVSNCSPRSSGSPRSGCRVRPISYRRPWRSGCWLRRGRTRDTA